MAHYPFTDINLRNKNNSQTQQVLLVGFNKAVLEIGPAKGYVTKELKKRLPSYLYREQL